MLFLLALAAFFAGCVIFAAPIARSWTKSNERMFGIVVSEGTIRLYAWFVRVGAAIAFTMTLLGLLSNSG